MNCAKITTPLEQATFNRTAAIVGNKVANNATVMNNNNSMLFDMNGNPSKLFEKINNKFNKDKALEIKANTFTDSFISKYGNWIGIQTEPILTDDFVFKGLFEDIPILDINIKNQKYDVLIPITNITKNKINVLPKYHKRIGDKLIKAFSKHGVKVKIIIDTTISRGFVETIDGITQITINPKIMTDDTLFHEFGHMYVDMIKDQDYIDFAVNQLRGTKLWDNIAALNGTLNDIQLGREVLGTAIGIEADQLFKTKEAQSKWRFIINSIIAKFAKTFNIKHSIAKELAKDLINFDLKHSIDNKITVIKQYQQIGIITANLKPYRQFLTDLANSINVTLNAFSENINIADYETSLKKTKKQLNNYVDSYNKENIGELLGAITSSIEYTVDNAQKINMELATIYDKYSKRNFRFDEITPEEYNNIHDTLRITRNLLGSFQHLTNFNSKSIIITKENFPNDKERSTLIDINNTLNKIINGTTSTDITSLVNLIDDISTFYDALIDLTTGYTMSLTSNPKFAATTDEKDFIREFKMNLVDEGIVGSYMDSGYDSDNTFVALTIKYMRLTYGERNLEIATRKRNFNRIWSTFNKSRINELIEDGRLVNKYDIGGFYKDMKQLVDDINELAKTNKQYSKTTVSATIDRNTYNPAVQIKENNIEETSEEAIERRKQEEKDKNNPVKYKRWLKDNFYSNEDGLIPKIFGEFKMPTDKYLNPKYNIIQNDATLKPMYDYLVNEFDELTAHIANSPQRKGFLPAISVSDRDEQVYLKDFVEENIDVDGNIIRTIPFTFLGYLNNKKKYIIKTKQKTETVKDYKQRALNDVNAVYGTEFETLDEVKLFNKNIETYNRENHARTLNTDLSFVIPLFIESAIGNKYKHKIESVVLNNLNTLKTVNLPKRDKITNTLFKQRNQYDIDSNQKQAIVKGEQSNAYRHLQNIIEMDFYDNFNKKAYDPINKFAIKTGNWIKTYSSLLGMGFNVHAGVKNITYGKLMTIIEGVAGSFFNTADVLKAEALYLSHSPNFIFDAVANNDFSSSKITGISKMFTVIENINDLLEKQDPSKHQKWWTKSFLTAAFGMQSSGEHYMHNITLLAMLNSHRLVDGKIVTLNDLYRNELATTNVKSKYSDYRLIKEANNEIKNKIKNKFNASSKLIDLIEIVNDENGESLGYTSFKEGTVSNTQMIFFNERVKGVNHKLHGVYNKIDKGTIEHYLVGRLVMQYHHWMRAGWVKRFKGINSAIVNGFDDSTLWNERREEYSQGNYVSFIKMFGLPMHEFYKNKVDTTSGIPYRVFAGTTAFFGGMIKTLFSMRVRYNMLSVDEKSGALRTTMEIALLTLAIGLKYALYDDDDEYKKPDTAKQMWFDFWANQLEATMLELSTYLWFPNEYQRLKTSPAAPEKLMFDITSAIVSLIIMPFQTDYQSHKQGGYNKGKNEALHNIEKITPVINQYLRWEQLDKTTYQYHINRPPFMGSKLPYPKKRKTKKKKTNTIY